MDPPSSPGLQYWLNLSKNTTPWNAHGYMQDLERILLESGEDVDWHLSYDTAETQDMVMELPPSLLVPFAVVLASLLIVGVVGNILVISVLIRARLQERSRALMPTATTTNAYILSLSAADLLFLVFCAPFQGTVYILNHWPYGWVMCKAAHYCQYCTVYASIWILTMMSVDRYVAIGHPLKSVKWRHPRQAMRISAVVWVTAALLSFPWLILYEADEHESAEGDIRIACYDAWSDATYTYRKWMILFVFLIGFLIPSCIIFCMAVLVAKSIRMATHQPLLSVNGSMTNNNGQQMANGHELAPPPCRQAAKISIGGGDWGGTAVGVRLRRRRRVGWLVFALAFLFFFCWMPHNLSMVWLNFDSSALDWIHGNHQTFFIIKLLAHMMTYMNSCINPVLYSLASNNFRGRFLSYACGRGGSGRGRPSTATLNSSYRCDNRTYVHAAPTSVWFRQTSLGTLGTSPGSNRKGSSLSAAARKQSTGLGPGAQRQQKFSLAAWPSQKSSKSSTLSHHSTKAPSPDTRRHPPCSGTQARSISRKRAGNFPLSIDSTHLGVPLIRTPSPRSAATPIIGAVHLISKRIEVARRAQKRRRSLEEGPLSNCSVTSSDGGSLDFSPAKLEGRGGRRKSR